VLEGRQPELNGPDNALYIAELTERAYRSAGREES